MMDALVSAAGTATGRGRVDKREAILAAAFEVFARKGYEGASVDLIASEAGVAKPTLYNHLGSKEKLFRLVMVDAAVRANARTLAVLRNFPTEPADLVGELGAVADGLAACVCDEQSVAARRLMYMESGRFPDLFRTMWASGEEVIETLAGRMARLAHAGYLEIADPATAATQFVGLVLGDLPLLTVFAPDTVTPAHRDQTAAAGVTTFLRAFARRPS